MMRPFSHFEKVGILLVVGLAVVVGMVVLSSLFLGHAPGNVANNIVLTGGE